MLKKIGIIGAATGQLGICKKAQLRKDIETYCFAWAEGGPCIDFVNHFVPISIYDMDEIVRFCRLNNINGIVSNGSNRTALVTAYVSEKLGLIGNKYDDLIKVVDKSYVREHTQNIKNLKNIKVKVINYSELPSINIFPCVVKPITGGGKKGVNYISSKYDLDHLDIPEDLHNKKFLVEEYIKGKEVSVETLSYKGRHNVIQITDKISSGPPHFVELGHLEPSILSQSVKTNIEKVVSDILTELNFLNGASHTELKINDNDDIYLIEVNPRGGGDMISTHLVELSTDCDFMMESINIALDDYDFKKANNIGYSGIYYICSQNKSILDVYKKRNQYQFIIDSYYDGKPLIESKSNYDRNGYIMYYDKEKRVEF